MIRTIKAGVAVLLAVSLLGAAPAALASGGDVKRGSCSGASTWKLDLSREDRHRIEVDLEVDQNVVGDTWRVVMRHNGREFFRDRRTTRAPSGSFEVDRKVKNLAGTDRFRATALNLSTDEVRDARASI